MVCWEIGLPKSRSILRSKSKINARFNLRLYWLAFCLSVCTLFMICHAEPSRSIWFDMGGATEVCVTGFGLGWGLYSIYVAVYHDRMAYGSLFFYSCCSCEEYGKMVRNGCLGNFLRLCSASRTLQQNSDYVNTYDDH